MTNRDVALIAHKILGLWLVALAVISAASVPTIWNWGTDPEEGRTFIVMVTLLPAITTFGVGYAIWFRAQWLATCTFPAEALSPFKLDRVQTGPLLGLAMSIIGLLFVCESIPGVVNGIALFIQSRHVGATFLGSEPDAQNALWSAAAKASMTAQCARFLIGVACLLGPARLRTASERIRREFNGMVDAKNVSEDRGSAQHGVEHSDVADDVAGTDPRGRS